MSSAMVSARSPLSPLTQAGNHVNHVPGNRVIKHIYVEDVVHAAKGGSGRENTKAKSESDTNPAKVRALPISPSKQRTATIILLFSNLIGGNHPPFSAAMPDTTPKKNENENGRKRAPESNHRAYRCK